MLKASGPCTPSRLQARLTLDAVYEGPYQSAADAAASAAGATGTG
jgi:hypothetical protein